MSGKSDIKRHIQDFEMEAPALPSEATEAEAAPALPVSDPVRKDLLGRAHEALCELAKALKAENAAALDLDIAALDGHADAKERLFMRLSQIEETAAGKGIALMDGDGAAEEEIRTITAEVQHLATENIQLLRDLGSAVGRVAANHAKAVEDLNSEGLYGASGRNLRAAELSPAGMRLDL